MSPLPLAACLALVLAAGAAAAERPAPSRPTPVRPTPVRPTPVRLCPEDLPEGVRLPPQPGCDAAPRARDARPARARDDGFLDLGGGTSVRIGGRAGVEFGARR